MAKDQKQPKNEDVNAKADPSENQKQPKNEDAPEDETKLNAMKIMPDPIGSLKKQTEPDGDDLAEKLQDIELDEKRPLCEPSLKKGIRRLATYRVTRLDGRVELCCIEEVGPGYEYKTAVPL
jgi:hypothetical protein